MPGHLPESMKAQTPAQMASLVIAHLGNVFGGLFYGIEAQRLGEEATKHPAKRETIALQAEATVKKIIEDALATLPEECDTNLIGLVVGKALSERYLADVAPVLAAQPPAATEEQGGLFEGAGPASGFAPLPGPGEVDPDPAPDTTL